jgi:hypothetical protein
MCSTPAQIRSSVTTASPSRRLSFAACVDRSMPLDVVSEGSVFSSGENFAAQQ